MRVKILYRGQLLELEDFDQLIVETDRGEPIAVAAKHGPTGTVVVSSVTAEPNEFNRVLQQLGINKSVSVSDFWKKLKAPGALSQI